jgi:hypothetical protein
MYVVTLLLSVYSIFMNKRAAKIAAANVVEEDD